MLQLKNIKKTYSTGGMDVSALNDVSLTFRKNEFVAILGQSGSGKTTLLNIIGGLDKYDSGDLIINGRSTKEYHDSDWDAYRNHSIGFVFQSYNLIPHQTVLSNVELALTLSGVPKSERKRRAKEALEKVGLGDQLHKKPNQMSGGQMQRVAIARALVNNPDILLADEPTGALDSDTSLQIMDILNEIAQDKLVIMVTHNPELAEQYANRIIRLKDGVILDDSNPYTDQADESNTSVAKKTSMSFLTALSLSLNNLMTKKTRTILTSFAGSIGIIGIALILSLSNGINIFINRVEQDTLSSYPLQINSNSVDFMEIMSTMSENNKNEEPHGLDKVYSNNIMANMVNSLTTKISKNDLSKFKEYIESDKCDIGLYTNAIKYQYNVDMQIYKSDTSNGIVQVNPSELLDKLTGQNESTAMFSTGLQLWEQLIDNEDVLHQQYDVIAGKWPEAYNEVLLVVNSKNEITDVALYCLGIKDASELEDVMSGKVSEISEDMSEFTYDDLLNLRYKLVLNTDYYEKSSNGWVDKSVNSAYMKKIIDNSVDIKICGIIRPSDDSIASSITGAIAYPKALTDYLINSINNSEIVKEQLSNPDIDVFTGMPFESKEISLEDIDMSQFSEEQLTYFSTLSPEEAEKMLIEYYGTQTSASTYENNIEKLGVVNFDEPFAINIYPKDFDSKKSIADIIDNYNREQTESGHDEYVINYTDYVELLMSSVTTIIDAISYVLVAFVAISLVVSSIMIGIITYISVLERTKEIGILRSIGASKRDVSRVFNAETLIVGFTAGVIGILLTLLLTIPINIIITHLTDLSGIAASLPPVGGIILVVISMVLTLIAGLIPSRIASKKDPVIALRTE